MVQPYSPSRQPTGQSKVNATLFIVTYVTSLFNYTRFHGFGVQ